MLGVCYQRCAVAYECRALYTHCYAHALNLAVADTVKQSKVCRDAQDTTFEITRLIKFSQKRNAAFDRIKSTSEDDGHLSPIGIHTFSHTRWTVRGDAIASILVNYSTLFELWEECLQSSTHLVPVSEIPTAREANNRPPLLTAPQIKRQVDLAKKCGATSWLHVRICPALI